MQTLDKRSKDGDSAAIRDVFGKAKEAPEMVPGLQYFLQELKQSSQVASSSAEKKSLRRNCRAAIEAITLLDFAAS